MVTRRQVLAGGALAVARLLLPATSAAAQPEVIPRAGWGADHPPVGPLEVEAPGDVRFLLLHHTVTPNTYTADDVPGLLRGMYAFHTTQRGWPDVAYNFFIDRFGRAWEGRAGSLDAPVQGSATGGSQGFAQLCAFIGDHRTDPPTPEAVETMVQLLAMLAVRYGIDPSPEATASFVSRGSNRWPAGTPVTTTTIAGHRDMSLTECPGDAGYALIRGPLPELVAARMPAPPAAQPESEPDPPAQPESDPDPPPRPEPDPPPQPLPPPQPQPTVPAAAPTPHPPSSPTAGRGLAAGGAAAAGLGLAALGIAARLRQRGSATRE